MKTRGRYLPEVMGDGLVSQINNPEVELDIARPDVRTRQLIMELRVATNRLRHAQAGQDTDFMDSESGSSSTLYMIKYKQIQIKIKVPLGNPIVGVMLYSLSILVLCYNP